MSRVKRGTASSKRRNYLLKRAKGFKGKSSTIYRIAKERLLKAEDNAYISRKLRKRDFRKLWIQRINGALDFVGSELNYSRFIGLLNKSDVKLNRKMISELAIADIENFKVILSKIEGGSHSKSTVKSKDESTTKAKPSAESTLVEKTSNIEAKTTKKDEVIEAIEESLGQEVQTLVKEAVVEKTSNHEETKSSKNDDLKLARSMNNLTEYKKIYDPFAGLGRNAIASFDSDKQFILSDNDQTTEELMNKNIAYIKKYENCNFNVEKIFIRDAQYINSEFEEDFAIVTEGYLTDSANAILYQNQIEKRMYEIKDFWLETLKNWSRLENLKEVVLTLPFFITKEEDFFWDIEKDLPEAWSLAVFKNSNYIFYKRKETRIGHMIIKLIK